MTGTFEHTHIHRISIGAVGKMSAYSPKYADPLTRGWKAKAQQTVRLNAHMRLFRFVPSPRLPTHVKNAESLPQLGKITRHVLRKQPGRPCALVIVGFLAMCRVLAPG